MFMAATEAGAWPLETPKRYISVPEPLPIPDFGKSETGGTITKSLTDYGSSRLVRAFTPAPTPRAPAEPEPEPIAGQLDSIDGVVRDIGENFITVSAAPGDVPVYINVHLSLCPDDVLYEGTPISISIDREAKYSTLKVEKREMKKQLPQALQNRISNVMDWANSL